MKKQIKIKKRKLRRMRDSGCIRVAIANLGSKPAKVEVTINGY